MKKYLAAAVSGFLIIVAQAQGEQTAVSRLAPSATPHSAGWGDWTRPLGASGDAPASPASKTSSQEQALADVDVVDAHWMALTIWGEARSQGEEGMRAVGHVIHNRWQKNGRYGAHVTDTVSQAWQFSCWNQGDPNREAMLNIDALPKDGRDYRLWLTAKRTAEEILSGQSHDPTGGALFYHTTGVSPKWSEGVDPVTQIGNHLFFTSVH